jgi:hypothetical protein
MSNKYRVQYSLHQTAQARKREEVLTIDLQTELEQVPGLLPAGAYIMYIEDLAVGEHVHWTRWPKSYRPGFGG